MSDFPVNGLPLPTVVWIDDDINSTRLLSFILERKAGVKVVGTALNAEVGRRMVEELKPDLIFLDHMMPGMDGIDAIHCIREVAPRTKLIFRSFRFPDPDIVKQGLEAGADRVISYGPLHPDEVVIIVQEVLNSVPRT